MGFAKLASPSLLLVDLRLEHGQGGWLPMLPHLTKRQRVGLGIDSHKRQQIDIALMEACSRGSRNDPSRTLDACERSSQYVLCGFEYRAAGGQNFRFVPTHRTDPRLICTDSF